MRRTVFPFAARAIATPVAACGGANNEPGAGDRSPIRVGQIVSLTGNYSALGTENQKSVALAVEQINQAGGILGRQIVLTVKDDRSQPDQSVLAFNELKEGSDAIIGSPFSNSALATIPLVDREEIPYLSLTPADEQVNPIHPYVFVIPATSGTSREAGGITGQAIGIGGDRLSLWSHADEIVTAYREGGWDADAIAGTWPSTLGREARPVGIPAPRTPETTPVPRP